MTYKTPMKATDPCELERRIMDGSIAKNEAEWWAQHEIERLRGELEIERVRLAACGSAALGYFEGCCDEYKSASLDDVLRLREKLAAQAAAIEHLRSAALEAKPLVQDWVNDNGCSYDVFVKLRDALTATQDKEESK